MKRHGNLKWYPEHAEEWARLKEDGLTLKEIAMLAGTDPATVWKKIDERKRRNAWLSSVFPAHAGMNI